MKPYLFLSIACAMVSCGGRLQPQSDTEVGIDAGSDSSIDIAQDFAASDVASEPATEAETTYETCPIGDGALVRVPANRRASTTCPARAPTTSVDTSGCYGDGYFTCTSDADCSETSDGFCYVGNCQSYCYSDACHADSDCGAGQVCACVAYGNRCIAIAQGDCALDSDCGPCGFCSLSIFNGCCGSPAFCADVGGCEGNVSASDASVSVDCTLVCEASCTQGYYCHTPQDSCTDDSDCGTYGGHCAFASINQSWLCVGVCPGIL